MHTGIFLHCNIAHFLLGLNSGVARGGGAGSHGPNDPGKNRMVGNGEPITGCLIHIGLGKEFIIKCHF